MGGSRRTVGTFLVGVLSMSGLTTLAVAPENDTSAPGWVSALEDNRSERSAKSVPWRGSSSAKLSKSTAATPAKSAFPKPDGWDVTLRRSFPSDRRLVRLAADSAAGQRLRVDVLGRAAAARVGASGFVFRVSGAPRGRRLPAKLNVDYRSLANAYGAGYPDRLRVLALPGCTPTSSACKSKAVRLPVRNDRGAGALVADADLASAGTFAVTADVGGDTGTFAASQLSVTGSWQVAPGSGAFTYSYPIGLPKPAGGDAPEVGLGYSSAAVDGLTLATNPQASPAGLGWSDFANAFIERGYEPCIREFPKTTDLCWKSDNATISLGGISGPLIPVNSQNTEWRVQADPGWKIERLEGAPYTTTYKKQYWKVTGPDGTAYYFGYGHMPGRQTNSILSVGVFADHKDEPCRRSATEIGSCEQGWRWYLDRVVDPDSNVTSYVYERQENWYASVGGVGGNIGDGKYHRAAMLKEIYYGGRGWDAAAYAARVQFGLEWRCAFLVSNCPAATKNHTGFPDVPTDLICAKDQACTVNAPAFFNARRYSHVRTEVKIGTAWKPVAQHNLRHGFPTEDYVAKKLQLIKIQQAGIAFDKLSAYPDTTFGYAIPAGNRIDHGGDPAKTMRHRRLTQVTNPFGGVIKVTYGHNRPCDANYAATQGPRWDLNVKDCFPQRIRDKDSPHPNTGIFRKFLVTSVVESPGGGSPDITTSYAYEGDPAWAFDTGSFASDVDEWGWSVWRGYGITTITKGSSRTRVQVFRGWHGDWMLKLSQGGDWVPVFGEEGRKVEIQAIDGTGPYTDHHSLAGRTLVEQQLGNSDSVSHARRYEYERRTTVESDDYLFDAEWVGMKSTTERVCETSGACKERRSTTTYNHATEPMQPPQPTTTKEEGWLDVSGDERCSITTYADNLAAHMFVYPAVNKKVTGDCDSTNVLSMSETSYDDRGNATRQRTLIEDGRWSETTTTFDDLGRPAKVTDPNGNATTTSYTVTAGAPAAQIPIRSTVTNAKGHQTVTDYHPEFGVQTRVQDANGNVTSYSYDEFGRTTMVWLPTEPLAYAEPSYRFEYDIPNRAVRSRRLTSEARTGEGVTFEDAWVIYDGFWRERQTQGLSPASGKALVAETTYDNRGLVSSEMVEQALAGTPGKYIDGGTSWLNRTRHVYDDLEREIITQWLRGSQVAHATNTVYGVDTVTVYGPKPNGGIAREQVDGLGRTVAVEEHDGQKWVSARYRYDLADRLLSVTDPAGNRITYDSNLAGWRTSQQDPDRGSASFAYDLAGNQLSAKDARGSQIHTKYDELNRAVERRSGSATGPPVASWVYDTAPGGKGKLHRETTHTGDGAWVSEVLGYDTKGRTTGAKLVVPAGIPGLSGEYATTQTYDRADRVRTTTYPAAGGLPQETVTTDYNALGLPTRIASGLAEYVWGVKYDDRGRMATAGLGPRADGSTWMARNWTYDADQRLSSVETFVAGSSAPNGVMSDYRLTFDNAGNLTGKLTRQNGLSWRECFGYDRRSQLTSAHTVSATASCADGTAGTGDRPYKHRYEYSPDGNLAKRVENDVETTYDYPAAGSARPHAPTRIGNETYAWNVDGSMSSRTAGSKKETYSWDVRGQLASMTSPAGKTSFVYDASGQRLLRRTPDGRSTLYVAGHEVTANADGSSVAAVRSYVFDGRMVATRSPAGVEYLMSDAAGSVDTAIPAGATGASATRAYHPYGRVRAREGKPATDRGFVGQIEDASTGLSYLNARHYDPGTGTFASTDPVYDTANIKSLNPYGYSRNNPTTFSDPGGTYSSYTFGLENENYRLRDQNKQLIAHIGRLNGHIEDLQGVIKKQRSAIKKLLTYVDALEAEIARQASVIRQLQAEVVRLRGIIVAQQREISRLRGIIAYQAGVIRKQAGIIRYYKGIVNVLGFRLWGGTPQYASVMASIHSLRGIPAGAFSIDRISQLESAVALQRMAIYLLDPGPGVLARGEAAVRIAEAKLGSPPSHPVVTARGLTSVIINNAKNDIFNPWWLHVAAQMERLGIEYDPEVGARIDASYGTYEWFQKYINMTRMGLGARAR